MFVRISVVLSVTIRAGSEVSTSLLVQALELRAALAGIEE